MSTRKTENLLNRFGKKIQSKSSSRFVRVTVGICLTVALVLGGLSAVVLIQRSGLQSQLSEINAYINSPDVQSQNTYYQQLQTEHNDLKARLDALDTFKADLESYPIANTKVNQLLAVCAQDLAEVEVLQYTSTTGELTINCTASDVDRINQFIAVMRKRTEFQVEEYSGYQYMEQTGKWSVKVLICLNGTAGR